jgi:hypothetical protein
MTNPKDFGVGSFSKRGRILDTLTRTNYLRLKLQKNAKKKGA